jgi:pilus assembly protein CpaC
VRAGKTVFLALFCAGMPVLCAQTGQLASKVSQALPVPQLPAAAKAQPPAPAQPGTPAQPAPENSAVTFSLETSAPIGRDQIDELSVVVGRSALIDCARPVERVSVGLGEFAEAIAISKTEVLVNGKAPGETSVIVWEQGGLRQFFNVKVRPSNLDSEERLEGIRRELREEFPGQAIKVRVEGKTVFLSGTVKDLTAAHRAVEIASASGDAVNLLQVEVPASEPQILLKVIFASVDRTKSNTLGLNLFSTGFGNTLAGVSTGQFSPPSVSLGTATTAATATLSNELNLFAFLPGMNLGATLQAMETKGLLEVLSEPNVLAENGKQASFLAGGEYPYPVVQGSSTGNSVSIQFKEYGVRLNFIPTITPRGTIHLQVAPEVSALDFSNAIEVSGFDVPAIDVRRVKTQIELAEGQSFAIGGLLDNRETETFQKIPFLGDIPILGKFFQSISKSKTNNELIVIVTPEIVSPIPAGGTLPELKFPEKFLPPNSGIPLHTPDEKPAGAKPPEAPKSMPVEQLIQSMKAEKPLIVDAPNSSGGAGSSTGGGSGAGASGGSAPGGTQPSTEAQ